MSLYYTQGDKKIDFRGVVNYEANGGPMELCRTLVINSLESHVKKHEV
jgi:hypothetical protein